MEFVLVVPRAELFRDCYPHGLVPFSTAEQRNAFDTAVAAHGFFVERARAERNPEWKQIIPYTLTMRRGELLLMRRLGQGGEGRLHGKLSIGVGGHVNPEDALGSGARAEVLSAGTRRELDEELCIEGTYRVRSLGLINDDSNPVGAVHLGLVQIAELSGNAEIRERDVLSGSFVAPAELRSLLEEGANFETWSKILVEHLDECVQAAPAAFHLCPSR